MSRADEVRARAELMGDFATAGLLRAYAELLEAAEELLRLFFTDAPEFDLKIEHPQYRAAWKRLHGLVRERP